MAAYLESKRIARSRIRNEGLSTNFAADTNTTAEGRRNNRRVEVTVR